MQDPTTIPNSGTRKSITFHKERLRRDPPAEFVAPDHPLFDAVVERILQDGRPALGRGTVFVDRAAPEPYLVWLFEAAVVTGEGQVVHRRLFALRQRGQAFEPVAPGVLLDLAPTDTPPPLPPALRALADPDAAIAAAGAHYADRYLAEVTAEQERQVAIVEKALQQSVQDGLNELQARLERQQEAAARGKDMALAIWETNRQLDELTDNLHQRRAALARQRVTALQTPRVVGLAAVVPGPVPHVVEAGTGGDQRAVERAAMAVAIAYERAAGRTPTDVSGTGVGYDIRSADAAGAVRYIEVKGHATTGDVTLYYTEWQTAQRMRNEFYIYVVDHALTAPRLWIVQDPVGKGVQPVEKVVEYHVRADQLHAVAEPAAW